MKVISSSHPNKFKQYHKGTVALCCWRVYNLDRVSTSLITFMIMLLFIYFPPPLIKSFLLFQSFFKHSCNFVILNKISFVLIVLLQEIDGQALLLLTLPTVQECMDLKLGPAIKLCHHIERVKIAFYEQFAKWCRRIEELAIKIPVFSHEFSINTTH